VASLGENKQAVFFLNSGGNESTGAFTYFVSGRISVSVNQSEKLQ
jgi:hypothetical protein